jgi:glycosyltransferase involved in cell wall biosynthesis
MAEIAVVIPAYNAVRFLGATLESVKSQSFGDWCCIVVDDGSTDNTRMLATQYAERDSRFHVISVPNGGQANARNVGARSVPPDVPYLIFLDADDVWEQNALQILLSELWKVPSASAAAGLPRDIDEEGQPIVGDCGDRLRQDLALNRRGVAGWRLTRRDQSIPSDLATLAVWCHIETPGLLLMRRSAFDRTVGFRGFASPSEDWDFLLQLCRLGPILHVPIPLLRKRVVAGSQSHQGRKMKRAEPNMRRLWVQQADLSPDERHILTVGHFYSCLQRFSWALVEARHGRIVRAAKHFRHGVLALGRFVRIEGIERRRPPISLGHTETV